MIVFLTGYMGSGKTSVGRELRRITGYPLIDMDEEIVRRAGMPVTELFATKGEDYFRALETEVLRDVARRDLAVISCGGGVSLREENRKIMKDAGHTVFLNVSPETVLKRLENDTTRPLLHSHKDVSYIAEMMKDRLPHYRAAADMEIFSDNDTPPQEIAKRIIDFLGEVC